MATPQRRFLTPGTNITEPEVDPRVMAPGPLRDMFLRAGAGEQAERADRERESAAAAMEREAVRAQREQAAAAEGARKEDERQAETLRRLDFKARGVETMVAPGGRAVPVLDEQGKERYTREAGPVEWDKATGKAFQMERDETGKVTQRFLDAKAKLGANDKDPRDAAIYRQNEQSPWERIEPEAGLRHDDPAVRNATADHLRKMASGALQREIDGLDIEEDAARANRERPAASEVKEARAYVGDVNAPADVKKEKQAILDAEEAWSKRAARRAGLRREKLALQEQDNETFAKGWLEKRGKEMAAMTPGQQAEAARAVKDARVEELGARKAALEQDAAALAKEREGLNARAQKGLTDEEMAGYLAAQRVFNRRVQEMNARIEQHSAEVTRVNEWRAKQAELAAVAAKPENPLPVADPAAGQGVKPEVSSIPSADVRPAEMSTGRGKVVMANAVEVRGGDAAAVLKDAALAGKDIYMVPGEKRWGAMQAVASVEKQADGNFKETGDVYDLAGEGAPKEGERIKRTRWNPEYAREGGLAQLGFKEAEAQGIREAMERRAAEMPLRMKSLATKVQEGKMTGAEMDAVLKREEESQAAEMVPKLEGAWRDATNLRRRAFAGAVPVNRVVDLFRTLGVAVREVPSLESVLAPFKDADPNDTATQVKRDRALRAYAAEYGEQPLFDADGVMAESSEAMEAVKGAELRNMGVFAKAGHLAKTTGIGLLDAWAGTMQFVNGLTGDREAVLQYERDKRGILDEWSHDHGSLAAGLPDGMKKSLYKGVEGVLPSVAETVIYTGAGALAGTVLNPGGGTVAGAGTGALRGVTGALARFGARKMIQKEAAELVAASVKAGGKKLAQEAALRQAKVKVLGGLAREFKGATGRQLLKATGPMGAAVNAEARAMFGQAGAGLASLRGNAGEYFDKMISGTSLEELERNPGIISRAMATALAYGVPAAAMDTMGPLAGSDAVLARAMSGAKVTRRRGVAAVKGLVSGAVGSVGKEYLTGFGQGVLGVLASRDFEGRALDTPFSLAEVNEAEENAILEAVGGGVMGGGAAVAGKVRSIRERAGLWRANVNYRRKAEGTQRAVEAPAEVMAELISGRTGAPVDEAMVRAGIELAGPAAGSGAVREIDGALALAEERYTEAVQEGRWTDAARVRVVQGQLQELRRAAAETHVFQGVEAAQELDAREAAAVAGLQEAEASGDAAAVEQASLGVMAVKRAAAVARVAGGADVVTLTDGEVRALGYERQPDGGVKPVKGVSPAVTRGAGGGWIITDEAIAEAREVSPAAAALIGDDERIARLKDAARALARENEKSQDQGSQKNQPGDSATAKDSPTATDGRRGSGAAPGNVSKSGRRFAVTVTAPGGAERVVEVTAKDEKAARTQVAGMDLKGGLVGDVEEISGAAGSAAAVASPAPSGDLHANLRSKAIAMARKMGKNKVADSLESSTYAAHQTLRYVVAALAAMEYDAMRVGDYGSGSEWNKNTIGADAVTGVASGGMEVKDENGWHYRIPINRHARGWTSADAAKKPGTKVSANIAYSADLVAKLDAFFGKVDGYYKLPSTDAQWDGRHDPLSAYLVNPLTATQQAELTNLLAPNIRHTASVNEMLGTKISDGIFVDSHPSKADAAAIIQDARGVSDEFGDAVESYLKAGLSSATVEAARRIVARVKADATISGVAGSSAGSLVGAVANGARGEPATSVLGHETKPAGNSLPPEVQTVLDGILGVYGGVFRGGVRYQEGSANSGGMQYDPNDDALVVYAGDLMESLKLAGDARALLLGLVSEEVIHAVMVKLDAARQVDVMGVWRRLPKSVQKMTRKAYGTTDEFQLAHEFLRMVMQGRVAFTAAGITVNGKVTEELYEPRLLERIQEIMAAVVEFLKGYRKELAKNPEAQRMVDDAIAKAEAVIKGLRGGGVSATGTARSTPEAGDLAHNQTKAGATPASATNAGSGGNAGSGSNLVGKDNPKPGFVTFPKDMGSLGIARDKMPQIKAEQRGALANFLKARGIEWDRQLVWAKDLKPSQAEYSPAKVEKAKKFDQPSRAILVAADAYIVDGHHQWMAALEKGEEMEVIRLGAPIDKVLATVSEFPSAETAKGEKPEPVPATAPAEKTGGFVPLGQVSPNGTYEAANAARTKRLKFRVALVDLAQAGNSAGTKYQPREIGRVERQAKVAELAARWNPELAVPGANMENGPIVVTREGGKSIVRSGHHREAAILGLSAEKQAAQRKFLKQYMEYLGQPEEAAKVDGMANPALAAEIVDFGDYAQDEDSLLSFVRDANPDTMSRPEEAIKKAGVLRQNAGVVDRVELDDDGEFVEDGESGQAVLEIIDLLGLRNQLTGDGRTTPELYEEVRRALLAYVLDADTAEGRAAGRGATLRQLLEDSGDNRTVNFTKALVRSAGVMAQIKRIKPEFVSEAIAPAVQKYVAWKNEGGKGRFREFLEQGDMFDAATPDVVTRIGMALDSANGVKALRTVLETVLEEEAYGPLDLFGLSPAPAEPVVDVVTPAAEPVRAKVKKIKENTARAPEPVKQRVKAKVQEEIAAAALPEEDKVVLNAEAEVIAPEGTEFQRKLRAAMEGLFSQRVIRDSGVDSRNGTAQASGMSTAPGAAQADSTPPGGSVKMWRAGNTVGKNGFTFFASSEDYAANYGTPDAYDVVPGKVLDLTQWKADEDVSGSDFLDELTASGVDISGLRPINGEPLQQLSQRHHDPDGELARRIGAAGFDSVRINEYVYGSGKDVTLAVLNPDNATLSEEGGLEQSPAPAEGARLFSQSVAGPSYRRGIPIEKQAALLDVAQAGYDEGVRTPEGLAKELTALSVNARQYSEAIWLLFRSLDPELPADVDWRGIYGRMDGPPVLEAETEESIAADKAAADARAKKRKASEAVADGAAKPLTGADTTGQGALFADDPANDLFSGPSAEDLASREEDAPFSPGEMLMLTSPNMDGPVEVNYRGPFGDKSVVVFSGNQIAVPTSQLSRRQPGAMVRNDERSSTGVESDSAGAASGDGGGEAGVRAGSGATGETGRPVGGAGAEGGDAGQSGGAGDNVSAAGGGVVRDPAVREPASAVPGRVPGDEQPGGSGQSDATGVAADGRRDGDVDEGLVVAGGSGALANSGAGSGVAEVKAAVPSLTEEQAGDVVFAETRLFEKGKTGVLLTNGTGTGKTFSGLGIVKRMLDRGARDILIVAPSDKVVGDWVATARQFFGVPDIVQLESTRDTGRGNRVVVTTYANFGQNNELVKRSWAAVVADEAHYLSQSAQGTETDAGRQFRGLTWHPGQGAFERTNRELADVVAELQEIRVRMDRMREEGEFPEVDRLDKRRTVLNAQWQQRYNELRAESAAMAEKDRPKAVLLSATPFAYHYSLDYAESYLFPAWKAPTSSAYNSLSDRDAFYVQNLGYRKRYNKLTRPENPAAGGMLERMLADRMMKEGAMRGRALVVPFDYSRDFVMTPSAVGQKVDEVMGLIMREKGFELLREMLGVTKYLERRFLLEAIKAKEAVPRIRRHLALGRQVLVFHDYKKGGAENPLRLYSTDKKAVAEYERLRGMFPGLDGLVKELDDLKSPLDVFAKAFPDAGIFNGDVPAKKRREVVAAFNREGGMRVMLAQRASAKEGISLHDTRGDAQRVFLDLGIPGRPTDAIQSEGRIYRHGVQSNAVMEYLTTGTNFERWTFAETIAQRASTAENLAMGSRARALLQAFSSGYDGADPLAPSLGQGTGGKAKDAARDAGNQFDEAVALYYTNQKKTSRNKAQEGIDYFPTPEPLGLKMVEWLGLRPGEKALEPSAGHGAIARWLPDYVRRYAVEPSYELAGRLALNAPDTTIVQGRFEDYPVVNKFNGIVMNPPFGTAGKTAMEHVEKAAGHLRAGGRLVAIIPMGSSMEKRFDAWYESGSPMSPRMVAEVLLPAVAFERAGTKVVARVVVLEKPYSETADTAQMVRRDLTGVQDVREMFERLREMSVPERAAKPAAAVQNVEPETESAEGPVADEAVAEERPFAAADFRHTKTGQPVYVAKMTRKLSDAEYARAKAAAVKAGGYYSSFKGAGAIPGFHFKTAEARDGFVGGALRSLMSQRMTPASDAEYLAAVEAGDMATAQRMVDAAAKAAGYSVGPVYHGTKEQITAFEKTKIKSRFPYSFGFHFTDSKAEAAVYATDFERAHEAKRKGVVPAMVDGENIVAAYIRIQNPLRVETDEMAASIEADRNRYVIMDKLLDKDRNRNDVDGVIISTKTKGQWANSNVIVFDPAQIKSADPVTRDESGRVIPLSERFNPASDSILRSRSFAYLLKQAGVDLEELGEATGRARLEKSGERTVGRPELGLGALDPVIMGMDAVREPGEESFAQWDEEARAMLKRDYEGTVRMLVKRGQMRGQEAMLNPVETRAAQMIVARESRKKMTAGQERRLQWLVYAYRHSGTEQARGLASRRDPFQTRAERHREFLMRVIYTPTAAARRKLEAAETFAEREQVMIEQANEIERVKKELARMGVTLEDIFRGEVRMTMVASPLAQQVIRAMGEGARGRAAVLLQTDHRGEGSPAKVYARIAKETGLKLNEVAALHDEMLAEATRRTEAAIMARLMAAQRAREGLKSQRVTGDETAIPVDELLAMGPAARAAAVKELAARLVEQMGFLPKAKLGRMKKVKRKVKRKPLFQPDLALPGAEAVKPTAAADDNVVDGTDGTDAEWEAFRDKPVGRTPFGVQPRLEGTTPDADESMTGGADAWGRELWPDAPVWGGEMLVPVGADMSSMGDVVGLARAVSLARATRLDMLVEYWINNLLSGPATHARNLAGNVTSLAVGKTLVRGVESLLRGQPAEMVHLWKGLMPGLARGWRLAKLAWAHEADFFHNDVLNAEVEFDGLVKGEGTQAAIPGKAGRVIRVPGRFLAFSDALFKGLIGQMEAGAQAYRIAKSEGLSGDALSRRMNGLLNTPGSQAWQLAVEKAEEATFQSKLRRMGDYETEAAGPVAYAARGAEAGARAVSDFANSFKLMKFIVPFIRTPYNILRTGIRMSPAGSLVLAEELVSGGYARMKDGVPMTKTHPQMVQHAAEQMIAWTAAAMLAGAVEGGEDDDDQWLLITGTRKKGAEGDLQGRTHPATSIRIGGQWYNYGSLEPVATALGVFADAVRSRKTGSGSVIASVRGQIDGKTFLKGLADAWDNAERMAEGKLDTKGAALKLALTALVPNLIRQPVRAADDYERDWQGRDWWYDALPLGSGAAPQANPVTGEQVEKPGNVVTRLLFPFLSNPPAVMADADKMLLEYNRKNPGDRWAPPEPERKIRIAGPDGKMSREVELSREALEYYQRRSAGLARPLLPGYREEVDVGTRDAIKKAFEKGREMAREELRRWPLERLAK